MSFPKYKSRASDRRLISIFTLHTTSAFRVLSQVYDYYIFNSNANSNIFIRDMASGPYIIHIIDINKQVCDIHILHIKNATFGFLVSNIFFMTITFVRIIKQPR